MDEDGRGGESGVSPVIAALLILALTVLLTGVLAVGILSLGMQAPAPAAGIMISENTGVITLAHFSGATLSAGEYAVLMNGIDHTADFQADERDFGPGMRLTWDYGVTKPLSSVSVVYTGGERSVVIAEKQFFREGKGEVNAAFTASVPEGRNATSQVKTGVSGTKPLPGVIADLADLWVVLDQVSNQARVEFTAEDSSPDLEFSWASGNEQTAYGRTADFVYDSAGLYTVRLDVRNVTSGEVGASSMMIFVRDPGVTALAWVKRDSLVTGGIVARTTGNIVPTIADGGWQIQYDNINNFRIVFKLVLDDSFVKSYYQIQSGVEMNPGTWYHAAGIFNHSGTTTAETFRIYVDGEYPTLPVIQGGDPTHKKYYVVEKATIKTNSSFNVASYSEVPFPLNGAEIAEVYAAEMDDPR